MVSISSEIDLGLELPEYLSLLSDEKFKFLIVHLNINSLFMKCTQVSQILDLNKLDIFMLNETKLNESIPSKKCDHRLYNMLRCDRSRRGGGIVVFIKKSYDILKWFKIKIFEGIYIKISVNSVYINIISVYKAPDLNSVQFLEEMENFLVGLNQNEQILIIGDINIDLMKQSVDRNEIFNFLRVNNLKNYVKDFTRHQIVEIDNEVRIKKSLIDLVMTNGDLIDKVVTIGCPFSDHLFVASSLNLKFDKNIVYSWGRNLSERNLKKILVNLNENEFALDKEQDIDKNWENFKDKVISCVDKYAPMRKFIVNNERKEKWYDNDLINTEILRNKAYKKFKETSLKQDGKLYEKLKKKFESKNRNKMINYFKDKKINDFKNSNKFWDLYSSFTVIKSKPQIECCLKQFKNNELKAETPSEICELFNNFFTSLKSNSTNELLDSIKFAKKNVENLPKVKLNKNIFSFEHTTQIIVDGMIDNLSNDSSPGISGIPLKIIKYAKLKFVPIITDIINECLDLGVMPDEWKSAIVTPLFKKGDNDDVNNYRGIAVLALIAKVFEKIIAMQILNFFNTNELLFPGQHGFRSNHGCETLLHEIISDMNLILSQKKVGFFLFIDYRKAFDLVDSNILLAKLEAYGFSETAMKLLRNYFTNRTQKTRYDNQFSSFMEVLLGVPQGSILGPLLFLIFINDLPYFLEKVVTKMFADDTALFSSELTLSLVIETFEDQVKCLLDWCNGNRVDINWSKTYGMFVTNKRIELPEILKIAGIEIEIVESFKLLGVLVDRNLNFQLFARSLRTSIYKRLFSIKRMFFLSLEVKIQFFKSFLMPYFDYCSTLQLYFSKKAIQIIANCYNHCLFKLFKINYFIESAADYNKLNNILESFGVFAYQHRVITRILVFSFKIIHNSNSPFYLRTRIKFNNENPDLKDNMRGINDLEGYVMGEENTFYYFFSQIINKFCINDLKLTLAIFKIRVENNINLIFLEFIKVFEKFDIKHKNFTYLLK